MIFDIGVIETFTVPYPKDEPVRYYVKHWEDRFRERLYAYYSSYNVDITDRRNRVHVYFDNHAVLKITLCNDDGLRSEIRRYVVNRYRWELENNRGIERERYSAYDLLDPYMKVLKEGYVLVGYDGIEVLLPTEQYGRIGRIDIRCYHTRRSTVIEFDSGVIKINRIIYKMIRKGDVEREKCNDAPKFSLIDFDFINWKND